MRIVVYFGTHLEVFAKTLLQKSSIYWVEDVLVFNIQMVYVCPL